jgi:hypothetical protein
MSHTQASKHSIGDEIPYRRDQIDKKTGSLVFDQHLKGVQDNAGLSTDKAAAKSTTTS